MVLAESVSIEPTALVLGLVIALLVLLALAALVVVGFRVALRAGRGEAPPWHLGAVVAVELLVLVLGARLDFLAVLVGTALLVQVGLFLLGRTAPE